VSAEKDIESCIEIVESIRGAGFPLKLYIVGEMGPDRYGRRIEDLCRARRDWIVLPGAVYGAEKWSILQRCRYGISACRVEAFGIATAEMSASGMIVFVPAGCAQTEIVTNPNQTYTTLESAVCKFLNILKEERLQEQFRSESKLSVRKFSTDVFATRVAATFHDYIDTSLSRRARQVP
jgi:glycosyltransferase involved in cell wall biosynthesis